VISGYFLQIGGSSGISGARGNTDYDVKERTRKEDNIERSVYVLFTKDIVKT